MTKQQILDAQAQLVIKSNDLIQKSQFTLTAEEQKVLLFMISKIKPQDDFTQEYIFSIDEYCKVANKDTSCGTYYNTLREVMLKLKKHIIHIQTEEEDIIVDWFAQAILDRKTKKTFRVMFAPAMKPYLFGLQNYYTRYPIEYILPMDSKYGIRMYEFLRSVKSLRHKQTYSLDELRDRCGCSGKFSTFKDLRVNVIEPALEEINKFTDLEVKYKANKTGKKVSEIEFLIMDANKEEREQARQAILGIKPIDAIIENREQFK